MSSIGRLKALSFAAAAALALGSADAGALDKVRQDKALRIAYRDDAPPFSFTDEAGLPAGFMVDLCRSVAKHIGEQLNINDLKVAYVLVTAENRFDAIENGKADLLCEPTSETLSRREQVDFSIPTFVDGASLLVGGDAPGDFARALRQEDRGSGRHDDRAEPARHAGERQSRGGSRACEDPPGGARHARQGGDRRLFRRSGDPLLSRLQERDASKLRLADNYFSLEPYALALPHGDEDFRLAVDRALSHIYRSGEIAIVFAHTFGNEMQPSDILKTLYSVSALPD